MPASYKEKNYEGYEYAGCDDAKRVEADGSTQLNVYYDKNEGYVPGGTYTLTFMDSVTGGSGQSEDLPITYDEVAYGAAIDDYIPDGPRSGRKGYTFKAWYLDEDCTTELNQATMPDHDLVVYAGWEAEWYIVTIDPNYGALYGEENSVGTGATWFWSSYDSEPIVEYTHVTRDYVESSSGTWYYVDHSGDGKGSDNGWPDRHTYYTQNPSLATEDTTFEYAPGIYTYAGWYEVHPDGTETPYTFGGHTDHDTTLRLHWKRAGTYYLGYDAGDGTLEDGVNKTEVGGSAYADCAAVILDRSALPPTGFVFVGWKVRGSSDTMIYTPGQNLILPAANAIRFGGKDVI